MGLIGLHIGMPGIFEVTILLRPGERADAVRQSLRERIEERCLVPFLHTGVDVIGDALTPPHVHMLVLARSGEREWRALHAFAFERNKRSGVPTSVDITEVYDLHNLLRMRRPFDPIMNRPTGRVGYLAGDRNLTMPGSKPCASQVIRKLSNELLAAGPSDIAGIHNHLRQITRRRWGMWP